MATRCRRIARRSRSPRLRTPRARTCRSRSHRTSPTTRAPARQRRRSPDGFADRPFGTAVRRIRMRWIGIAMVLAYGVAHADAQLAGDPPAPAAQLASGGRCEREIRLVGHDPAAFAQLLKARKLREVTLERILLPSNVQVGVAAPQLMTTVTLGDRQVRGIYSNIAGDGCIRSDIRHAVD